MTSSTAKFSDPSPSAVPGNLGAEPQTDNTPESLSSQTQRVETLSDTESADSSLWEDLPSDHHTMATTYLIPPHLTTLPPIRDSLVTETSEWQDDTAEMCLPFLTAQSPEHPYYNTHGVPHLRRAEHIRFCHKALEPLPAGFVAADAARPWFFYWNICALAVLGEDVSTLRERMINTARPLQNATGGFAGGYGQLSHLAPTYATVLALGMVGGEEAIGIIDRKAMWEWLCKLKQPNGGFQLSVGGEVDVRGAYTAVMVMRLLQLPLDLPEGHPAKLSPEDNLLTRLGDYVSQCQKYEGGIGGRPDAEPHGAYAYCALACLALLGDPRVTIAKYLDVPSLIYWLSSRQYAPEGGFAGRTNKLVDGCYSHWIGGCWPLVEAALEGFPEAERIISSDSMYDRDALIRYILSCGQDTSKRGGLRDKPSARSDGYHTCYLLAGLSSAQHKWRFSAEEGWSNVPYPQVKGEDAVQIIDREDRVKPLHPVYVVPVGVAESIMAYSAKQGQFV